MWKPKKALKELFGIEMKKERLIVLTGAGGNIGRCLIKRILEHTEWRIIALSSSLELEHTWGERVKVYRNNGIAILSKETGIDTCIHLAFSRRFKPNSMIASSLDFSANIYKAVSSCNCRLINLSTVGVYGINPDFPDENTAPFPDSFYSLAKYASEVLMQSYLKDGHTKSTNLRLSGVAQCQRVLPIFIENAKSKGEIQITGGQQQFSWIDIDDATDAIIAMIAYEGNWRPIYNVTLNKKRYLITEIAELVSDIAEQKGYGQTKIVVDPSEDNLICTGWNSDAFMNDTGWRPQVSIRETIEKML